MEIYNKPILKNKYAIKPTHPDTPQIAASLLAMMGKEDIAIIDMHSSL